MYPFVKHAIALDNYCLQLQFSDGKKKLFDVSPYLNLPVFQPLKNQTLFKKVQVAFDTVSWAEDIDIDPEFLYEKGIDIN